MANKYANLIGTNLIKDEYTKINTGFDGVEADMKAVESAIENHGLEADPHDQYALDADLATLQTEVTAHKAENVSGADGVHGLKYEEGTWTPVLAGSDVAGVHTYYRQIGKYIKIKNHVTCYGIIQLTAKDAAMAGLIRMTGLPYVVGGAFNGSMNIGMLANLTFDAGELFVVGQPVSTTSRCDLTIVKNGAAGAIPASKIANNFNIRFTLHYYV